MALGTQVIIDARTRQVRASLDAPGSGTSIFAVDLIGDTWQDFSYFTEKARAAERAKEFEKRNRFVRAAIASMFSHLDGLVSKVVSALWNETAFFPYRPKNANFCALKSKIVAIHDFLRNHRGLALPMPDMNLKLLRDVLNHPSVSKPFSEAPGGEVILLEGPDVYGVAIEDLDASGLELDRWLNAICLTVPYERFPDTKRLAEDFARALGSEPNSTQRF